MATTYPSTGKRVQIGAKPLPLGFQMPTVDLQEEAVNSLPSEKTSVPFTTPYPSTGKRVLIGMSTKFDLSPLKELPDWRTVQLPQINLSGKTTVFLETEKQRMAQEAHNSLDEMRRKHYGSLDNYNRAVNGVKVSPTNTGGTRRPKFVSKLGDLNLTDEEKNFITLAGFDPTNARSLLNFILSKASNANLGARKGAGVADGYFGDKSLAAFQALRNQGIFKPKVDAQEPIKSVNETPVDAPNFGYATNQDYSNGRQFKNLGFNNYQGLLRYAQGSQDQFAQDLRQRFGDRITDQAYVESQLGISGKYRGGSAGDFGDMARSMQTWKTNVNQQFDNNRAAYAKKQLDARTGSTGTVYSSPEMMKKFESVKVSPEVKFGTKFNFSNMKFNSGLGTTGANTLGDAGAGTMNNLK